MAAVDASAVMSDARFTALIKMVEQRVDEMGVVSVSNVLWALARLKYPVSAALTDVLAARAARECKSAEPRHLSTVMWALAVGVEPREDRPHLMNATNAPDAFIVSDESDAPSASTA